MKAFRLTTSVWGMLALLFTACASAQPQPQIAVNQTFENQITLLGYTWNESRDRLQLFWQARSSPTGEYAAFVHILDAQGKLVAQFDQAPGSIPTSRWKPGEMIIDEYVITQPNLAFERFTIRVGLFNPATGKRLGINGNTNEVIILTVRK
jgi:hypothetical protein